MNREGVNRESKSVTLAEIAAAYLLNPGALPPGLGRLEIFDGAGHGVHRDKPDDAERLMREFLAG